MAPDALKTLDDCMKDCLDTDMISGETCAHGNSPKRIKSGNNFQVIDMPCEILDEGVLFDIRHIHGIRKRR